MSNKSRNADFYLDGIRDKGREFQCLEAISTDGDIRPPYAWKWRAKTKIVPGDDDPFEGLGGTPLEALRELYKAVKASWESPEEDEE